LKLNPAQEKAHSSPFDLGYRSWKTYIRLANFAPT
jgi:hypothetical protein